MVCDRIVLIGDNYSEIRDLKLIEEVKMPVDVVICAASKTVRSDYLTLAKVTGGQLIWNGKTVPLDRLSKGDQIQVGEVRYQWDGDEFVEPRR